MKDGIPQKVIHHVTNTSVDKGDEGKVQTYEVATALLEADDYVFVSLWAVNNVSKHVFPRKGKSYNID